MSERRRNVRDMSSKPVDSAPYAAALRAADPRLRKPPAGSLALSQPFYLDALREARFAAYRARDDVRPPVELPERAKARLDPADATQAWNASAAAYRARLSEAPDAEPSSFAAKAAESSRSGAAAAREALRQDRKAS
jgi:hypothetical protein